MFAQRHLPSNAMIERSGASVSKTHVHIERLETVHKVEAMLQDPTDNMSRCLDHPLYAIFLHSAQTLSDEVPSFNLIQYLWLSVKNSRLC